MSKTTATYWNVLADENRNRWQPVEDTVGMLEQLTLAMDASMTPSDSMLLEAETRKSSINS
jgi:hypothetical protein